jgi:diketogulonate reductase-like aldo/keto reductase
MLLINVLYRYNKSTAQLLIRWCLERGFVCIPKSVKEQRIIENGDVFDFKISDEDMQVLVSS